MKAQSSLELTTTYSWALIIIGVFIAALMFYGTIDRQESNLQGDCRLGPQFVCAEVTVDQYGHLNILYMNSIRDEIILKDISFTEQNGNCPGLPKNVGAGTEGKIQCYLSEDYNPGETVDIEFNMIFSDKDNNAEFQTQSQIITKATIGNEVFEVDCDNDGDNYDIIGCGASNDCNDTNPEEFGTVQCSEASDCGTGFISRATGQLVPYECQNPGTCAAKCYNPLDQDGDGVPTYIKAQNGIDCNDNDPKKTTKPACGDYDPCKGIALCKFANTCKAVCQGAIG